MTNDRHLLGLGGRLWVVATVGYGALRVALAGAFVANYGLNIVVFALVELTSSLVLGMTTARIASSIVAKHLDRRPAVWALAIVSYFAPDAYVLAFAGRMPARLLVPVLLIVMSGLVASVVRLRRVRSGVTSAS